MKNLKTNLLKHAKTVKHFAWPLVVPEKFIHKDVPYFSQWESPELAQQILKKQIHTDDDPNWRNSGAQTKKEYHEWSWSGCGMACTKMILAHRSGEVVPLVVLGKKSVKYGVYTMPLEESIGLLYKPYVHFVAKELSWEAKVLQGVTLQELMHELGKGNYVIAGVSPQIRYPHTKPKTRGGHLILIVGYDKTKREFYLHNPSGISKATQQYAVVRFNDFKKFFSGRGIIVQGSLPETRPKP